MKSSTIRAGRVAALAIALVACTADRLIAPSATIDGGAAALTVVLPDVRISEFHYDNAGTDAGEKIEISGPAGASVAGWKVILYNGNGGASYSPTNTLSGTIPATCGTRGVIVVDAAGLQNGAPDGIALVNALNQVIEFLSYEGTFAATSGPASGLTSVDVGAAENGDEPIGGSLQRDATGIWTKTPGNTFGACNDNGGVTPPAEVASVDVTPNPAAVNVGGTTQLTAVARDAAGQPVSGTTFIWTSTDEAVATVSTTGLVTGATVGTATIKATAPNGIVGSTDVTVSQPAPSAGHVRVSEFHYDNVGTDADEKIELEGDAGGSLTGWKIYLYSGTAGSSTLGQFYSTISISGTFGNACVEGTRGVLTFAAPGLQNGENDGFAVVDQNGQVVEFLSYEGSFAAVNGPATGMTATDVGVSEANAPAIGRSLQRAANGTWFGPFASTFDACNADTPPAPVTGITFTGRSPVDDAPLPVGYQDQLFATLRDENTGASVPTTFTWTSDTPDIATVDQRGQFTALAAGNAIIRATAANGVTNTTTLPTEVAALGNQSLYRDPLAFGVPTDGTPFDELRVSRPQYQLSYNQAMGRPNWAAYHLSTTVRGNLPGYRCDCFTADPAVSTMDYPGLSGADYTGSGFDRGHMVRSNDRELAHGDQATTYYMSNIVPQYGALNQHRWAAFEDYLQTVADGATHPEVYIVTGPRGNVGTIADGRVAIPTATWKVAVVLPAGMTPDQVQAKSDIIDLIAVDMPNISTLPQDAEWQLHKTTVDAVEAASGYDLLSALPDPLEAILESGDHEPTAHIAGAGLAGGSEGQALTFDGFTSSDPDVATLNDVLSYSWSVNGAAAGTQAALTHTFGDNGTYSVRLIVTDKFGAADTASASVTVTNIAPTVNAFAGATILRGETYTAAGTFSDPGADTFTGTVNYGDGTGTAPLALGSASFSLSHAYATAGTYTVTVAVGDDDGGSSSATATVTVVSAAAAINTLSNSVTALELAGTISGGEANALQASLKNALKSIEDGNTTAAANQLGAFINKVEAMRASGRISAATAQALIDYANRVIASI
jgi:DNA/RNA endonuclease G (NUC1)